MRKQCVAAVRIEHEERVPEIGRLARQLLGPGAMSLIDRFCHSRVVEAGHLVSVDDALRVDLNGAALFL